jgi:hypothetical protein
MTAPTDRPPVGRPTVGRPTADRPTVSRPTTIDHQPAETAAVQVVDDFSVESTLAPIQDSFALLARILPRAGNVNFFEA